MFVATNRLLTETARKSVLGTGDEEVGILADADVGLLKANIAPSADTLFADITEASFNTYARVATTGWGVPFRQANGFWLVQADAVVFVPTDALEPNTIFGYCLFENGGNLLLGIEMFDTPIVLASPTDSLTVVPRIGPFITAPYGLSLLG